MPRCKPSSDDAGIGLPLRKPIARPRPSRHSMCPPRMPAACSGAIRDGVESETTASRERARWPRVALEACEPQAAREGLPRSSY